MTTIYVERGIKDLFQALEQVSRYKDSETKIFPNGVYRVDIPLRYGVIARFLIDPSKRVPTLILVGTNTAKGFKAIQHFPFKLDFERLKSARTEAEKLEKFLQKIEQQFRYRIKKVR